MPRQGNPRTGVRRGVTTGSDRVCLALARNGGEMALSDLEKVLWRWMQPRNVRSAIWFAEQNHDVEWTTLSGGRRGLRIVERRDREAAA